MRGGCFLPPIGERFLGASAQATIACELLVALRIRPANCVGQTGITRLGLRPADSRRCPNRDRHGPRDCGDSGHQARLPFVPRQIEGQPIWRWKERPLRSKRRRRTIVADAAVSDHLPTLCRRPSPPTTPSLLPSGTAASVATSRERAPEVRGLPPPCTRHAAFPGPAGINCAGVHPVITRSSMPIHRAVHRVR